MILKRSGVTQSAPLPFLAMNTCLYLKYKSYLLTNLKESSSDAYDLISY